MAFFEEVLWSSSYEYTNTKDSIDHSQSINDAQDFFQKQREYQDHIRIAEEQADAQEWLSDVKHSDAHDAAFIARLYASAKPLLSWWQQISESWCERVTKSPREDITSSIIDLGISHSYSLTSPGQSIPYLILQQDDLASIRLWWVEQAKKIFFEKVNLEYYVEQLV